MTERVTDDDRGKEVLFRTNRVGTVTDVRGDDVYVDPDFDVIPENIREEFGWEPPDDRYTFDQRYVTAIGNGEVHLRDDLLWA